MSLILEDKTRILMCMVVVIFHLFCILITIFMICYGLYMQIYLTEFTALFESYSGDGMQMFLMGCGFIFLLLNAGSTPVFLDMCNPEKRVKVIRILRYYVIAVCFFSFILAVSALLILTCWLQLEDLFKGELTGSMNAYIADPIIKVSVDRFQFHFKCCGNDVYTDWFDKPWMSEKYVDRNSLHLDRGRLVNGVYVSDDVPYSCCDRTLMRPCIHDHIHDNEIHFNYIYQKDLTVYKSGCRVVMMDYFGYVVIRTMFFTTTALLLIELLILVMARLLATSFLAAIETGIVTAPANARIFNFRLKLSKRDYEKDKEKLMMKSAVSGTPVVHGQDGSVVSKVLTANTAVGGVTYVVNRLQGPDHDVGTVQNIRSIITSPEPYRRESPSPKSDEMSGASLHIPHNISESISRELLPPSSHPSSTVTIPTNNSASGPSMAGASTGGASSGRASTGRASTTGLSVTEASSVTTESHALAGRRGSESRHSRSSTNASNYNSNSVTRTEEGGKSGKSARRSERGNRNNSARPSAQEEMIHTAGRGEGKRDRSQRGSRSNNPRPSGAVAPILALRTGPLAQPAAQGHHHRAKEHK